jgi:hypothetical protein
MKAYRGSGGIDPRILDLGTRCRWMVSFTPRPLYPQGRIPWYPLDRRLGGTQSRSGHGEGKNSQPLPGLEPPIIRPVVQRYTTELWWFPSYTKYNQNLMCILRDETWGLTARHDLPIMRLLCAFNPKITRPYKCIQLVQNAQMTYWRLSSQFICLYQFKVCQSNLGISGFVPNAS